MLALLLHMSHDRLFSAKSSGIGIRPVQDAFLALTVYDAREFVPARLRRARDLIEENVALSGAVVRARVAVRAATRHGACAEPNRPCPCRYT